MGDRPAANRILQDPARRGVKKTRFGLGFGRVKTSRLTLDLLLSFLIESRLSARIRLLDGPELTIATICPRGLMHRLIEDTPGSG
jgi:hypothetical protein